MRRHLLLLIVPLSLLVIQFVVSPSVLASEENAGPEATSETPGFSLPQPDPGAIPRPSLPDLCVPAINLDSFPRLELPDVQWPSFSVPQPGHPDWKDHFYFPKGLDPGIVVQPDVPKGLDPGIEGLPYFPKELDPDYMGLAGQIVDGLLNGQITWEQYGQLMEENLDIKDKVAPWVEFLVGLKPDGTVYVRDLAIGAALMAIPMGKLAQLGKVPAGALLQKAGGRWVIERLWFSSAGGTVRSLLTIEKHHLLPSQFKELFERAGLNIEDFAVPLPKFIHRPLHEVTKQWTNHWNKRWAQFFRDNPEPTRDQIMQQLYTMIRDFELLPYIDQKLFSQITSAMGGTALRELLTQVAGRIGVPSLPSLLPGWLP